MSTPPFFLASPPAGFALPAPFLGGVGASRSRTSSARAMVVMPSELDKTAEARMLTATRRFRNMYPRWMGGEARPLLEGRGHRTPGERGFGRAGVSRLKSLITTGRYNPQGCGMLDSGGSRCQASLKLGHLI